MKIFLFALVFMGSGLLACSQDMNSRQVPAIVKNTLLAKFPDAINLAWQHQHHTYQANFKLGLTDYAAIIDDTGKLVMYKKFVNGIDLPKDVTKVLQTDFANYRIEDLEKVEKAGEVYYQVELEKANQQVRHVFSPDGQIEKSQTYWN